MYYRSKIYKPSIAQERSVQGMLEEQGEAGVALGQVVRTKVVLEINEKQINLQEN